MTNASLAVRRNILGENIAIEQTADIDITADGAWQRRGYASLNGVVTIIEKDSGKCINFKTRSKKCGMCEYWNKQGNIEREQFMLNHDCPINHIGSASSMESCAIVECFKSSVTFNKLRFKNLYW